jgi:hypothetical protein
MKILIVDVVTNETALKASETKLCKKRQNKNDVADAIDTNDVSDGSYKTLLVPLMKKS